MNALIDLRKAQHAIWLSEELSFSRAARRAHLSQTAFSRSIQTLEAALGLQLFDRGTRHVAVTAAGAQWLANASTAVAQAKHLAAVAHDLAGGDGGELRIGATPLSVDTGVAEALAALRARRPRLRVRVESGPWNRLHDMLHGDQLELYVGYPGSAADQQGYRVRPLKSQPTSVFARASHPLLGQAQIAPRQLLAYPWACVQMPGPTRAALRQLALGAELPLTLETENQALLRNAVLQTDTLLLTWPHWLRDDLERGRVVDLGGRLHPVPPAHLLALSCAVVWREDRNLSPAAQQLMLILCEPAREKA